MRTYSFLLCLFFSVSFVPNVSAQPSTEDIRYVQEYLSAKNLYTGYIDGIDGPLTKKAVLDYEQQSGKRLTGEISKKLINYIRFKIRYELQVQEKKELNYKTSEWSILALVVGLTAYIGTIRRRFLDKIKEEKIDTAKRKKLIYRLNWLMVPDSLLILAGLCIAAFNLLPLLFKKDLPQAIFDIGISAFGIALIVLAIFHVSEWRNSRGKENSRNLGQPVSRM